MYNLIVSSFSRPKTVSEGVYEHLLHQLVSGRLEPGQWLREQELAVALSVSRTPVREAVRQLAQEGLLVIEANRGVRVPVMSLPEAISTYEVRTRLESMAAGLAARNINDAARADLKQHLDAMESADPIDQAEHIRLDNDFHALVARQAHNPVLEELVERLSHRVMRIKILTRDINVSALARSQHAQIVAAVSAGNVPRAEDAMAEHIRSNLEIVADRLKSEEHTSDFYNPDAGSMKGEQP